MLTPTMVPTVTVAVLIKDSLVPIVVCEVVFVCVEVVKDGVVVDGSANVMCKS